MRQLIPLALSIVTVVQMWKVGDHKTWAWTLGIANQAGWLAFIVVFEAWGLLLLNGFMVLTYARNLAKWRREEQLEVADV